MNVIMQTINNCNVVDLHKFGLKYIKFWLFIYFEFLNLKLNMRQATANAIPREANTTITMVRAIWTLTVSSSATPS